MSRTSTTTKAAGTATPPSRTAAIIRAEIAQHRMIAARLPAQIEAAAREHAAAMEEFDAERGRPALAAKRKAEEDLKNTLCEIAALEVELTAADVREAEEARRERYDAAKTRADAARENFVKRYPELAGEIVSMLSDIANADLAIAAVNEDLPEGGTKLRTISNEIFSSYEPRVDLEDEEFERWIRRDQAHSSETAPPLDPSYEKFIREEQGRHFVRRGDGIDFEVIKARLVRREYLPAVNHHGDGFVRRLCLPGLAHQPDLFRPVHDESPESIFAVLRELEEVSALVKPGREPQTEIMTLSQAQRQPLRRAA